MCMIGSFSIAPLHILSWLWLGYSQGLPTMDPTRLYGTMNEGAWVRPYDGPSLPTSHIKH